MILIGEKGRAQCLLPMLLLFSFSRSLAQYDEEREYPSSDVRYITVGVANLEFTPRGTNSLPDSLKIRFKRVMPMVSFRQGPVEVIFGYATYDLLGRSKSSIFLGGRFGSEIPIAGRNSSALLFPLQIAADFTKAEGAGPSRDDFNIANVGVGGGLKYRYVSNAMDFSIGIQELAQYSSEGIGIGSGFSASTLGDAVILLRGVNVLDGFVLGYRFRLQTWSMNQSKLNYGSTFHGPYLGIMF